MANPFVHLELNTPDLEKAKAFYGQLCVQTLSGQSDANGRLLDIPAR